jgi:hypothetical protein
MADTGRHTIERQAKTIPCYTITYEVVRANGVGIGDGISGDIKPDDEVSVHIRANLGYDIPVFVDIAQRAVVGTEYLLCDRRFTADEIRAWAEACGLAVTEVRFVRAGFDAEFDASTGKEILLITKEHERAEEEAYACE